MEETIINPVTDGNEIKNESVTSSEKKNKNEMGSNIAAGSIGGIVGGAVGAAIGSVIANEANAQENPGMPEIPEELIMSLQPETEEVQTAPLKPEVHISPVEQTESEVEVLNYEDVQTEEVQAEVVSDNGEDVQIDDVSGDDVLYVSDTDMNPDDQITEEETDDVSDQEMSTRPLGDNYQNEQTIQTETGNSDYINDANVDDFFA